MNRFISLTILTLMLMSCQNQNPFFVEWDTPYGIPPFEQIKEEHYLPAVKYGIEQQQAEVDAIIANQEEPTFENVVAAFERSGSVLDRVAGVLFNVSETDGTDKLQAIVGEVLPMLSESTDNIFMNADFFAKVEVLYKKMDTLGLTREQEMVLTNLYRAFVQRGVALNAEDQAKMREINKQLSSLEYTFGNNVLAENNAFAEEFGVAISEYGGAMATTSDRALREKMFKAYASRGGNGNQYDNKDNIVKIMQLRIEKAKLLGYENPAQMILSDKMAGNPEAVNTFLAGLMKPAAARAKQEIVDMQVEMNADIKAGLVLAGSKIQPWDWAYYTEKVRKAKYALDEEQTKPYFQMENVRAGVFNTAHKLYGLNFEKLEGVSVYNPEAEVFKVTDADASLIGILITDYFPRSTKRGGAWMNNFVNQEVIDGVDIRPVIVNVGNFSKPVDGKPSLMTLDEVSTMFHEFGHALHGLLSKCHYKSVSGASVARDFVELPSQINENWAFQKEVLAEYARHYQTGEVIPDELVAKIEAAGDFNQGFMTSELVAASILDMQWHCLSSVEVPAGSPLASDKVGENGGMLIDPIKFEAAMCKQMGLIDEIIPRYRSTYFNHIFTGGYSAGYYSYLWAEVLDKDAFELFMQKGIFDKETAMSFRHNILEKGGSEEPMTLYRRFRGQDPDAGALIRARGL